MLSKFINLLHTLSHLKPIQAIYQVKSRLLKTGSLADFELASGAVKKLDFYSTSAIHKFLKIEEDSCQFDFLNLSKKYSNSAINWNDQTHGKLWNYNLQYLDFLKQEDLLLEAKITITKDIYSWLWIGKLRLEPYPASLRIMNMIRFLGTNQISEKTHSELKKYVLAEVNYLSQNLEYHVLANHLLENAFALWMGANFFQNPHWLNKAEVLLKKEIEEQILPDGAHYELAPMYHQIILFRMMEAFHFTPDDSLLKPILRPKAELMLGWLRRMSFSSDSLPHFNDTTEGIAVRPSVLLDISERIGLIPKEIKLKESGYRIFERSSLKLITDIEGIKPTYQPGHAHADTFSFVLYHGSSPVIVDPGISTYAICERRGWERSTVAHNTLTIDRRDSSQVWSGFRVGKRAKVEVFNDTNLSLSAAHNGFFPQIHKRTFIKEANGFRLSDKVDGIQSSKLIEIRFYLHPDIQTKILSSNVIQLGVGLQISFLGECKVNLSNYKYCIGFNKLQEAKFILVTMFGDEIDTLIYEDNEDI